MKHLMTLIALVVAVTAGAQVMDTILTGNTVNMNLNYAKLDSIIADLQAKVATLEAAQNSSFDGDYSSLSNKPSLFDGDYSSLSNQPTIPSNVGDLTNDAGYTTFDGNYVSLNGVPTLATVATSGSYTDLSDRVTQRDIVESAYNFTVDGSGNVDLSGANLYFANLANAKMVRINLSDADFSSADLNSADLHEANLSGADLSSANLSYADVSDATLANADLSDAVLEYTYLSGANLSNVDLSRADLRNADLTDADLTGVTWTGAYILNCTGCTCTNADNDNYCD